MAGSSTGIKRQDAESATPLAKVLRGSIVAEVKLDLAELKSPGLEITNGAISKGSFELLPWDFMKSSRHGLKMTWVGTEAPASSTLSDHQAPFLTFVQSWFDAGDHPVQGRSSKTTIQNSLRKKFVVLAIELRNMLTSEQQRMQMREVQGASIDVWSRYLQLISSLLGQMPGSKPQEQWMASHLPAIFVLIWQSVPFGNLDDLPTAAEKICKAYDKHIAGLLQWATKEDTVMKANPRVQAFADWCSGHHLLTPDISDLRVEQTHRVTVLHEIETLKKRVFADEVFLKALAEPHDELMNRLAGLCNYDYHRVGSHQCGNASGR